MRKELGDDIRLKRGLPPGAQLPSEDRAEIIRREVEVRAFVRRALALAAKDHWDFSFRKGCEPRIFTMPTEDVTLIGVVWKQEEDGLTWVLSQVELPWLKP